MSDAVIRFEPASASTPAELTALWNRAYESYYVPLVFTEAHLSHHMRRSGMELDRSLVGRIDGEPFGLSCIAVRGERAWLGGFGVAKEHRRRGLAARMLSEHLMRLDLSGVRETVLEVISHNPARELYRAAGFVEQGPTLLVIGGVPRAGGEAVAAELDAEMLAKAHAGLRRAAPLTWRRDMPTLLDDLAHGARAWAVMREGQPAAFAVVQEMGGQDGLLDAAAIDPEAGEALLGALARRRPDRKVRIIDEPEDSPLARAMKAAGFETSLTQVFMSRPRGG